MYKKIYRKMKKYSKIVIARHIGPDPDAVGAAIGLKESIKLTFPKKEVYAVGASASKFKYLGICDKMQEEYYENALLIVLDTPDIKRIDGVDITRFKEIIKIDHHPFVDKFADIELIDEENSSASQLVLELINKTRLKLNKEIAEKLFIGLVSDTNRFLFKCTSPTTHLIVANLMEKYGIDFPKCYEKLYMRPMSEVRVQGYIEQNMQVTEDGVGYIKMTKEVVESLDGDFGGIGNLVNNFNYISEVLVWVTLTEDPNLGVIKAATRSRGPEINKVLEKYNGGGHKYASGARLESYEVADLLINDLNEECKKYKEKL